jgi:hypothetical protein
MERLFNSTTPLRDLDDVKAALNELHRSGLFSSLHDDPRFAAASSSQDIVARDVLKRKCRDYLERVGIM